MSEFALAARYATLSGKLKSDHTSIEIELNIALRALARGDSSAAKTAIEGAQQRARLAQVREPDHAPPDVEPIHAQHASECELYR